jgi:hypothetical protein
MATSSQEKLLQGLASGIDEVLEEGYGEKMGFLLVATPFGGPEGISDYIGNMARKGTIELLRKLADRLEKNETMPTGDAGSVH